MPKPTIVLVHGAWADGSSWNAVAAELQGQGFTVLTPPNLLRGVGDRRAVHRLVPRPAHHRARRAGRPLLRRLRHHQRRDRRRRRAGAGLRRRVRSRRGRDRLPDPRRVRLGARRPRPDHRARPRRLPGRARGRRRGVPQARHGAQLLRPGPARGGPLADRGEPAADHPEREHHPVRRAGVEDAAELGGGGHRGPGHPAGHPAPAWPSAPARRSPRWPARTCRWCRTRRSRSTRSSPRRPPSGSGRADGPGRNTSPGPARRISRRLRRPSRTSS